MEQHFPLVNLNVIQIGKRYCSLNFIMKFIKVENQLMLT